MPSRRLVSLVALLALAVAVAAAPQQIPLDPVRPDAAPVAVHLGTDRADGVSFTVELGALQHEALTVDGRTWTALTLPAGALIGDAGTPGLPVWSTLVVVPDGAVATVQAIATARRTLAELDLLPVQPDQADRFVIDSAWYAVGNAAVPELVSLGEPARMAGVTVRPLTIRPVSYDAGQRAATVATRIEITLDWTGATTTPTRPLPPSMRRMLAEVAVNPPAELDAPRANDIPGTWLAVCPDIASVRAAIAPLADWRRRQGYHVVVTDLAETGPTTVAIKAWLESQYQTLDPPLEYVVLVGDATGSIMVPTWNETVSGFHGEGDHYYTNLDGADILADVHVGRLSCRSISELDGIVAKIIAYESTPPMVDTAWYTSALVVGDPVNSGITTVYCGEWLAAQLAAAGFDAITEVYGGNFASAMVTGLNQGKSLFGYRGFYGMSGFSASHALYLTNGPELPFACFPTCLTGSFRSDTVCRSEAFLANANGGAIGAIGTATGGTHTRYNNCYFQGTWEGMVNSGDHHQGAAHTRGKLELYRNYQQNEPNAVETWSVWNNLMGDPATDVWTSVPRALAVDHPAALPVVAGALPVVVSSLGEPVADARVAVVQDGTVLAVGLTAAAGTLTLPLAGVLGGTALVTVTGHGLQPYLGEVEVADQPHWVTLDHWRLDDAGGDDDGQVNPGEALELDLVLRNVGTEPATGVTVAVTSESSWLTVTQPAAAFGAIPVGGLLGGDQPIGVTVAAGAPDQEACPLRVEVAGDQGSWTSRLDLAVVASRLEAAGSEYSAGEVLPGTSGDLVVNLVNAGSRPVIGAGAVLRTHSHWATVTDSLGTWGALPVGGNGANAADPFAIALAADCPRGYLAPFTIALTQQDGTERRIDITLAVGEADVHDPTGPDLYGYLAYDSTDTTYPQAPTFQWLEIDPNRGGQGTDVGLADFGYEQDDTRTVDLPFPFRYYGEQYDQLSICSNGWIAMGETALRHYRNWTVPSAGSPDAMIAVFWDDLKQVGMNRVYHWYDAANHRYVVQWSHLTNSHDGMQNCEVTLYDPAHHPSVSGDGAIVCQYELVQNNDTSRGYATVGIQDHTRTDGVLYTYFDRYAPGAAPLVPGLAVAYLPLGVRSLATCDVDPTALAFAVPAGGQQSRSLHVANNGAPGSELFFTVTQQDPAVSDGMAKNLVGSTVTIAEAGYEPLEELSLHLLVYNGSTDVEWIIEAAVDFPPGVDVLDASDLIAPEYTLQWNGATGDAAHVSWSGPGYDVIGDGETGEATVTIVVDQGLGDLVLPWRLAGDEYGLPPHTLTGAVSLPSLSGTLRVDAPTSGAVWSLGETRTIAWFHTPDVVAVDIELTRDGSTWATLASAVPAADGSFDWTVSGPVSGDCRVRVTSVADPVVSDTSDGVFTIQHDLSWLSLDAWSGTVAAGESLDLTATADAAGLADGVYSQDLVIANNTGSTVVVPVTLAVGDVSPVDDLPQAVALAQNRPNPFNPSTTIDFALPAPGPVDLAVYDLAGRRVAVLVSGLQRAGRHTVVWQAQDHDGRPLPSGTYVYRLRTGAGDHVKKLTLVK